MGNSKKNTYKDLKCPENASKNTLIFYISKKNEMNIAMKQHIIISFFLSIVYCGWLSTSTMIQSRYFPAENT